MELAKTILLALVAIWLSVETYNLITGATEIQANSMSASSSANGPYFPPGTASGTTIPWDPAKGLPKPIEEANLPKLPPTGIKFDEEEFSFGTIDKGQIMEHIFKFTNIGTNPLVVHKATASCGCTIPSFSKEPVKPGGRGEIKVTFESGKAGGSGSQAKLVLVTANTNPANTGIRIKANIIDKSGATEE